MDVGLYFIQDTIICTYQIFFFTEITFIKSYRTDEEISLVKTKHKDQMSMNHFSLHKIQNMWQICRILTDKFLTQNSQFSSKIADAVLQQTAGHFPGR